MNLLIKLLNYIFPFLIRINQDTVLGWFGIEGPGYKSAQESFLAGKGYILESAPIFTIETLKLLINGTWFELKDGLCVADLDRTIVFILIIRFILVSLRYNIRTSTIITMTSAVASYIWYNKFLTLVLNLEQGLTKLSYTRKLAVDSGQIRDILTGTVRDVDYKIRITNPIGILMFALGNGSIQDGHRIDPISMFVSILPDRFGIKYGFECVYYLFYRRIIPYSIRFYKILHRQFYSIALYTAVTRMNKKNCPYLIRWHWTMYFLIGGIDRSFLFLLQRIDYYVLFHLVPEMMKLKETIQLGFDFQVGAETLRLQAVRQELFAINYIGLYIMCVGLLFSLYMLLHAACGQYAYIPFFTENVELNIGPRDKFDIYSGGLTAWQNPEEQTKYRVRLWYGWFGRGTKNEKDLLSRIRKFILKIFRLILMKIGLLIAIIFVILRNLIEDLIDNILKFLRFKLKWK